MAQGPKYHVSIMECVSLEHRGLTVKAATSDYADYFAEKIVNKQLPPRPRTMSSTTSASLNKPIMSESFKTNSVNVKRKPLGNKDATLNALLKKFERPPIPPVEGRPEITTTNKPTMTVPPSSIKPPKSPRPQAKQLNDQSTIQQQQQPSRPTSCITPSSSASTSSSSSSRSPVMPKEEQHSQSRQQTTSTTDLGISMQQGQSCMYQQEPPKSPAHHHQQPIATADMPPPRSPIQPSAQQQRPASYQHQYQQNDTAYQHQQPPRSPMISSSNPVQQQGLPPPLDMAAVQQQQKQRMMYHQQQQQPPRSPVMPPPSPGYTATATTAPRSPIMMAPRSPVASSLDFYQQQQPPRSPIIQQQQQQQPHDMFLPSHSPIQPYAAPTSLAPTTMDNTTAYDPRWQQQQASPYMQPAVVQQQQQHDPYAWSTSSNYELPDGKRVLFWGKYYIYMLSTRYSHDVIIVRALYDYNAADPTELSFCKNNLFAVTGMSIDEGWWEAELWDETWHCSRASGCIPHNFMVRI